VQKLNPLSLIRQNQFLKNSAIFWSASLGVAFVNYLYYPVLGRVMQPVDYGEVQTIISIFNQISVFFQVLGLIGVGIIIRYPDEEIRTKINNEISRLAIAMSVLLLVAIAVLSPELKNFFHFQSISPFLGLSLSLLISVPLAFSN
jgi:O-antigen/teichoic acid export membrane protein